MSKVSHAVVGPIAEQVREGLISITEFVNRLDMLDLIVMEVALSETPTLDHMSRPVAVKPYIVARIIHADDIQAAPVEYALQTPQPL